MKPRKAFNPKRRLQPAPQSDAERAALIALEAGISYGGNPEHKRNPGDFGLDPPCMPRQGKSLCDAAEVFKLAMATAILREGIRKGLISTRLANGWPRNIWAVAPNGVPLEAQLENPEKGIYHGYPMQPSDPLTGAVLSRWRAA
jgi:hypothetical protein